MMHPIIEEVRDKKIAILGFGREGKSTYAYIRRYLQDQMMTIADEKPIDLDGLSNVELRCGRDYQELDGYDIIFKSPGIVLDSEQHLDVMNSQSNMFLKHYGKQTVGITGTKGKSTTSSLLHHMLKENGKDSLLLGNIGKPAFDAIESISEESIIVFELSCHQLEYTHYAPHIGVLLNVFEEHLDHYGSFEKYVHAKENVWRKQSKDDLLLCEKTWLREDMLAHVLSVSMEDADADIYVDTNCIHMQEEVISIRESDTSLLGHHNLFDIAIDLYLASYFKIDRSHALSSLKTFAPLTHRLEFVGIYKGIRWYDDSISTICETTIQALKTLHDVDTLLVGGMDRGIDYQPLASYLLAHPIKHIILMPDSGEILGRLLKNMNVYHVSDLEQAVHEAYRLTSKGKSVLLSPAAASYGFFKNFEERGDKFQSYVKNEN